MAQEMAQKKAEKCTAKIDETSRDKADLTKELEERTKEPQDFAREVVEARVIKTEEVSRLMSETIKQHEGHAREIRNMSHRTGEINRAKDEEIERYKRCAAAIREAAEELMTNMKEITHDRAFLKRDKNSLLDHV